MSLSRYDLSVGSPAQAVSGAALLYISAAKYEADWHSILHSHAFTEVFYVLGGKGRFQVRSTLFPVAEGDLVIVEPNTEHTETSLDAAPLEYIVLGIEGFVLPTNPQAEQPYRHIRFQRDTGEILGQLKGMLRETQRRAPGFELVCQSMLNILLVQVARRIGFATDPGAPLAVSRETAAARRYIDIHFRENITLDTLAQAVHISKYHLAHTFQREYGISPISYLHTLRMRECRELLRTSDYSVAQVARMAGFSSPSYFSQRFRAAEGMTPAQYRQKFLKLQYENTEDTI